MKAKISVVNHSNDVVTTFDVSRTEKIDRDVIALHLEMLRDGSWKLFYDKSLFPSLTQVSRLEIEIEESGINISRMG